MSDTSHILDRTTFERWDTCPFMAWAIETGLVVDESDPSTTGIIAHAGLAEAVNEFYHTGTFTDVTVMDACLGGLPPHLGEAAWHNIRRDLWSIREELHTLNRNSILRYQGGDKKRGMSGQLGVELGGAVVATSEIDLLTAGTTKEELQETDWKTGRTEWTTTKIKQSFQFRFHAWLVFHNYEGCEKLQVRVWMHQLRKLTLWVTFLREDFIAGKEKNSANRASFEYYLHGIAQLRHRVMNGEKPPTFPEEVRCGWCRAIRICPRARWPARNVAKNPKRFAEDLIARIEKLKKERAALNVHVKANGPVDLGDGRSYGEKPPSTRQTFGYLGGDR